MDLVKVFEAHGVLRTIQEAHDTKLVPIGDIVDDGPSLPPGLGGCSEDDIDDDLSIVGLSMMGVSARTHSLAR